jgi:hypothetical protein
MPHGLAGAPATLQSVVEEMVQVLDTEDIMAYLDDVICFHVTFERTSLGKGFLAFLNKGFQMAIYPLGILSMDFYTRHRSDCVQCKKEHTVSRLQTHLNLQQTIMKLNLGMKPQIL